MFKNCYFILSCTFQIISDIENKKEREVNRLKAELKEKLKLCKTEEEKQQVDYCSAEHDVTF